MTSGVNKIREKCNVKFKYFLIICFYLLTSGH